jgi:RimJ/RimL family protein N-acetyltransferase
MVYADQVEMPVETPIYPDHLERKVKLADDSTILLRPLKLTDEPKLRELFYALSNESVYHRFFQALKSMPHSKLQKFMAVDYKTNLALVACTDDPVDPPIIGVGHYVVDPKTNLAEVAFLVADEHQAKGIGSEMLELLTEAARSNGMRGFTAFVMADNHAMQRVFHKTFKRMETRFEGDVYEFTIVFDQPAS